MKRTLTRSRQPIRPLAARRTPSSVTEQPVCFDFSQLTHNDAYTLFPVKKSSGQEKIRCEEWMRFVLQLSVLEYKSLFSSSRKQDGFELIPIQELHENILDQADNAAGIQQLAVFSFGGRKYRMAALPLQAEESIIHVIGFDWEHNLYDHGS